MKIDMLFATQGQYFLQHLFVCKCDGKGRELIYLLYLRVYRRAPCNLQREPKMLMEKLKAFMLETLQKSKFFICPKQSYTLFLIQNVLKTQNIKSIWTSGNFASPLKSVWKCRKVRTTHRFFVAGFSHSNYEVTVAAHRSAPSSMQRNVFLLTAAVAR